MSKSIARMLRDGRPRRPPPFADDEPAAAPGLSAGDGTPTAARRPGAARILAFGLSHHTAPVDLRERLALDEDAVREHLRHLCAEVCDEALIVSTCNRCELYAVMPDEAVGRARAWLHALSHGAGKAVDRHLREYEQSEAVAHLFRVACSLDSLVVGEPQILGQVKDAVRIAEEVGALGFTLGHLARHALAVAKRVRTETAIGRSRVGVGRAGVELARQLFGALDGRRALLVGVGKMGRQVAKALLGSGLSGLLVANRTLAHAQSLAAELECSALLPLTEVGAALEHVDIVITATSAMAPIIGPEVVRQALHKRRHRPLFFIDLAVPRNIDAAVGELDGAYLFDVVNGGRNPPKSGDALISGSDNASPLTRDAAPKRGQGQAAALCSLAKRTLDAA